MSQPALPVTTVITRFPVPSSAERHSGLGTGDDEHSQYDDAVNNTDLHFYGPQFIVDSEGNALNLSLPDKELVTSHPFHGGLNQQWLFQDDGNTEVALMSRYNRTYVAPKDLQDATLVLTNVPFWFEIYWDISGGYRLVVPNTELGLSLTGGFANLLPLSRVAGIFILQNTPKNQQTILRGGLTVASPPDVRVPLRPDQGVEYGAHVDVTVNKLPASRNTAHAFPSDGIKNLVINLGCDLTNSNLNPSSSPVVSKGAKPVISQSLPVPTASSGRADIIGFGMSGVSIVRNSFDVQKREVISSFGYDAGGWRVDKHVRLVADTTGDKCSDIVGFGETGVWISRNNGDNTFQKPEMVLGDFAYTAGGWRVERHLRFMADIRNTGRADIVGFGDNGVLVSLNNGDGTFTPPKLAVSDFGYHAGSWRLGKHLRFLADVNGNGLLDIVGFGNQHVDVGYNNGDGTFQPAKAVLADLCYNAGWRVPNHPRFVADLTGDGKADLVGFGNDGIFVAFNNGDGTFRNSFKVSNDFCRNRGGWLAEKHLRFIADLTGNGCGDILGFGENGVSVSINNGDGTFQPIRQASAGFGFDRGWRVEHNPRLAADLTGDGRADIIGFGNGAVFVSYNDGKGDFGPTSLPKVLITDFGTGVAGGAWSADKTVRYVANMYP